MYLTQNIKGLCSKLGINQSEFMNDMEVDHFNELTLYDLEAICEEYKLDLFALLFKPLFIEETTLHKLTKIKLLVLDVDGVMTDGGMYFTENGDQFKKYNVKDGMGINQLIRRNFQIAIISSGHKFEMVKARADVLGIQHCYVGTEPKLAILEKICSKLQIGFENVALIGDDINDLEMMANIGFSACPSDAVYQVKEQADLILSKAGGQGCVREFIDAYLIKTLKE